jgi:dihydrofolate reductase
MGRLILGMNVSLDGYVDGPDGKIDLPRPSPQVFRYWIDTVRSHAATIYGRRMYEVMRYWDDEHPEWDDAAREFAEAWRAVPKWVVSRTLRAVGPNATLIPGDGDIEAQVRDLKARTDGIISVSGPEIAGLMTRLGLVDQYQMIVCPCVLGRGKPFFHDARFFQDTKPPLRLISVDTLDDQTVRLVYEPK